VGRNVVRVGKMLQTITNFLADWYLVTKALHVVSVISWMAGMFYLPRLFVYHVEQVEAGSRTDAMFQTMERRLMHAIINPAMGATWLFGLALVFTPGVVDWSQLWPWVKAACVLIMSWFHGWLSKRRKEFAVGTNTRSGRTYRIMNEVPTVLMVIIVFSVILRY
jgi:putative membrane protein